MEQIYILIGGAVVNGIIVFIFRAMMSKLLTHFTNEFTKAIRKFVMLELKHSALAHATRKALLRPANERTEEDFNRYYADKLDELLAEEKFVSGK